MTSKFYKPHINGKTKRPGTHWYHYLGPTIAVVAEKPDLSFGRFRFHCNFKTVRNPQKKDHVDEFKRSKNGGKELWGGLKWPKNGRKSQNSGEKTVQPSSGSPSRSRRVWRRLAVKFYGRHRPVVPHLVVRHVYSNSFRWCLVWSDFSRRAGGYSAQMVFPVWRVFS